MGDCVRHICFDIDGTLYGLPQYPKLEEKIFDAMARTIAQLTEFPLDDVRVQFKQRYAKLDSNGRVFKTYGLDPNIARGVLASVNIPSFLERDERLVGLFENLKLKGVPLSYYSNNSYATAQEILSRIGLRSEYFLFQLTGEHFLKDGKSVAGFEELVRRAQVASNEVMYVGDRMQIDILPAKKAGLKTALVVWGKEPKEDVLAADFVLQDIYSLEKIL
ncbi:HAD family hydrolase [Candidatus Woesearchaeota archaeon]|nr:HAD family hydrolase [Candidatus Woesearchaeota archaeon]